MLGWERRWRGGFGEEVVASSPFFSFVSLSPVSPSSSTPSLSFDLIRNLHLVFRY